MLIVIEGIDGSGKGTQAQLLAQELEEAGKDVVLYSFPRYNNTLGGELVGEYLNAKYGEDVHPILAATLYAIDRFETLKQLQAELAVRDIVICDRYVPSNLAHQSAKLDNFDYALSVMKTIDKMEHEVFGLPVPDLVICLDLCATLASKLIEKKATRDYTDKQKDLHEANFGYLQRVRNQYDIVSKLYVDHPEVTWEKVLVGGRNDKLREVQHVFQDVNTAVTSFLSK